MGTPITIHGGQGSDTINFAFTVTGTNTTHYAVLFENEVNTLLGATSAGGGGQSPVFVNATNTSASIGLSRTDGTAPVYVTKGVTSTGGESPAYTALTAGYFLDTISGGSTLTLDSVGGDTVLVAAINSDAYIVGSGSDNQITFVTGANVFNGSADTGGDTVTAGSGQDSIYTSLAGSTTVYSGTGSATIVLQDTTAASAGGYINDLVYLQDGSSTVYASGMYDGVIATIQSQTIVGYTSDSGTILAGSQLVAVLGPSSDGSAVSNDLVMGAGSATVYAYDQSSGNTVEGGAGQLVFVGGAGISATVDAGTGQAALFGGAGDNITLGTVAGGTGSLDFFAGAGNESLNGAGFTNLLYLFGGQASGGITPSDTLVGGSGANLLTAGSGTELLQGGTGDNFFQIGKGTSENANITINDFSANGTISTLILDNFSAADQQAIYGATEQSGASGIVVTIGDSTTVTFTGITSGSQLQGHIISF
jgi:hypothetical protein